MYEVMRLIIITGYVDQRGLTMSEGIVCDREIFTHLWGTWSAVSLEHCYIDHRPCSREHLPHVPMSDEDVQLKSL